jgi:PAS domain S-box-containing protein
MENTSIKSKMIDALELVAPLLPGPVFWKDKDGVWLGINDAVLRAGGFKGRDSVIGKSDYELWPQEVAEQLRRNDQQVMATKQTLHTEEFITLPNGETRYFRAMKSPLFDDNGEVIGIIGNSIDITESKENERLRVENEAHKAILVQQERHKKTIDQAAHDIRSPVATVRILTQHCTEIPENFRFILREAATSINDIANNLINSCDDEETASSAQEHQEPTLVSSVLLNILADKKYQYKERKIKFEEHFSHRGYFSFVNAQPIAFKRMMSNIVNNAVEALPQNKGDIIFQLDCTSADVEIIISDTGNGMSVEQVGHIMNDAIIISQKENGHGIGLVQVKETLQNNQGRLNIESTKDTGTKIILTFPRVKTPSWIVEEIRIKSGDIIIILDDDRSIHMAWESRFKSLLRNNPDIKVNHFRRGEDVIDFIDEMQKSERNKILLLSDYELLGQPFNGLDVIKKTKCERAILVTSYYSKSDVRSRASKMDVKLLPKHLAHEIPIEIHEELRCDLFK